jgi:hypothetical protein
LLWSAPGLHLSLFLLALSALRTRKRHFYKIHILAITVIFSLATLHILMELALVFWGERAWDRTIATYMVIYINPSFFRDAMGSASASKGLVAFVTVFKLVFVLEKWVLPSRI